ncbi:class I SAM-dependent methyltransferase [Pollutibacter soli]|uniref:class I SAM-dependent methyltransferase n=1 Tax=Pollutibacter soli TaxID=3034157 RepID=UPI003013C323
MKWDANLYDNNHSFVSKYGEDLINVLGPAPGEIILDIGSGSGDLADLIVKRNVKVIGIDNSREMVEAARNKYPHIQFDIGSASNFSYDIKFDAVFSNATLHWVPDYEKAITCIGNALKTGGRFVAEFGGKGNVSNITDALKFQLISKGYTAVAESPLWYFPSLSEYTTLLEQKGFRVTFAAHFDRETLLKGDDGMKNWLIMFGKSYLEKLELNVAEEIINRVENQLRATNFKNGNWYADYVRLRFVAIKV